MNGKHTPGPWLVMGNQRNGHYDFVLPQANDGDFQANARLIAACPVMYEFIQRLADEGNTEAESLIKQINA